MSKGLKTGIGGKAFFIKRDKNGKIVGDYVVSDGYSIFTKVGQKNAGDSIRPKDLSGGDDQFNELITSEKIKPKKADK